MAFFREIKVDLDVWKEIVARMKSFDERPNEVLRRVFELTEDVTNTTRSSQIESHKKKNISSPLSFKDAAIEVLKGSVSPMHYREISNLALERKLLTTTGLTPDQTMSATLSTDSKVVDSTFIAHGKGYYSLRDNDESINRKRFAGSFGFILHGNEYRASSAKEVLIKVMEELLILNSDFTRNFAARPKHGRNRRYISVDRRELYPNSPHLIEKHSFQLSDGYWVGTNYSQAQIRQILQMACDVENIKWAEEFILQLEN